MLLEKNNLNYFDKMVNDFFYPQIKNSNNSIMKTNIIENEDSYILYIEVPGVKKENIDIKLEDKHLIVSTSIKEEKEDNDYILKEYNYVSKSRSYYVDNINIDDIKAKLEDGILTLTILKPKEEKKLNKKIVIE